MYMIISVMYMYMYVKECILQDYNKLCFTERIYRTIVL